MKTMYSAMLLSKCGQEVNEVNMQKVLTAAGAKVDPTEIKVTVAALKDVNIDEVIKNTSLATSVAAPAEGKAGKAEVVEEKKEDAEKAEADAASGLGALFG